MKVLKVKDEFGGDAELELMKSGIYASIDTSDCWIPKMVIKKAIEEKKGRIRIEVRPTKIRMSVEIRKQGRNTQVGCLILTPHAVREIKSWAKA